MRRWRTVLGQAGRPLAPSSNFGLRTSSGLPRTSGSASVQPAEHSNVPGVIDGNLPE